MTEVRKIMRRDAERAVECMSDIAGVGYLGKPLVAVVGFATETLAELHDDKPVANVSDSRKKIANARSATLKSVRATLKSARKKHVVTIGDVTYDVDKIRLKDTNPMKYGICSPVEKAVLKYVKAEEKGDKQAIKKARQEVKRLTDKPQQNNVLTSQRRANQGR